MGTKIMNAVVALFMLLAGWSLAQQRSGSWTIDAQVDPITNERTIFIYTDSNESPRAGLVVLCANGKVRGVAVILHRYLGSNQKARAQWRFGRDTEPTEGELWLAKSGDFAFFIGYERMIIDRIHTNTTFALRIYGPVDTVTYTFNVGGLEEAMRLSNCSY